MNSKVVITYSSNIVSGDEFSIQDSLTPTQLIDLDSTTQPRLIGSTLTDTLNRAFQTIQLSYNNTNIYVVSVDYLLNTITIDANNSGSSFSETSNNTSGAVSLTFSNVAVPTVFDISTITASESASSPCTNVKLTITSNVQATNITSPVSASVGANPFIVDVQRTGLVNVIMNDSNNADTFPVFIPSLVSADFSADVINAPNGGTVTVSSNYTQQPLFSLEYSIDNVSFYSTNSFSGITGGSYNIYVRDGLGCSFSLAFAIDAFTPPVNERVEFGFVSNLNSFRFKVCQDLTTNIATVSNTLSYEENVETKNLNYKQPFQKNDGIITTQIKSSYGLNEAKITDSSQVDTALTVTKKTTNLNIEDVRDGTINSVSYLGQGYVGVSFGSGNTYDPVTLSVDGTYSLGNNLPDWIDIGEYLNLQNAGWIKVIDIIPVGGVSYAIMNTLTSSYPETIELQGLNRRITSVYDLLPYEVYEFDVDLSNLEGCYQISIDLTDADFNDVSFLSERIDVQERFLKTYLMRWYNTVNNEINYSTGITGKARFHYIYNFEWLPNSTNEVFVTDTNTTQIDSRVREFFKLTLYPVPTAISQKFIMLTSNDRIFGNDVNFIKESESEVLHIGSTNLYQITQILTRGDYVFNSISSDGSINIESGTPLAIEGLGSGLLYITQN